MLGVLISFLLGGFSVILIELTALNNLILQPIREFLEPIALTSEQIFGPL
jgi:hypothetical protein